MPRSLAIGILAALAVACATPITRPQLEAELASASAGLTPPGTRPQVFAIHAQSRMEAWTQLTEEQTDPESAPLSGQLSRKLASSASRGRTLVVGGPHAELTDQVVRNALAAREDRPLRGLILVYVSPAAPSPELRAAARRAKVALHHQAMRLED